MKNNKGGILGVSKLLLASAALCAAGLFSANAAIVATWDFTPTFTAGTTVNTGGTLGSYVSAANLNGNMTQFIINNTIQRQASGGQSDAFMRYNPNNFSTGEPMNFILQLTASADMSDFAITYYAQVSNANGSDINTWAYSLNNGGTWLDFDVQRGGTTATSWTQYTVSQDVSVSSGSTIWFRNTLSGATGNNYNTDFDTISITAVPEPAHYALGLFGLLVIGARYGRGLVAKMRRQ